MPEKTIEERSNEEFQKRVQEFSKELQELQKKFNLLIFPIITQVGPQLRFVDKNEDVNNTKEVDIIS